MVERHARRDAGACTPASNAVGDSILVARRDTCVLWNSVPRDWAEPDPCAARALADCAARPHAVVVRHDVHGACLASLGAFLHAARAAGHEFTRDLPPACVPMVDGAVTTDLRALVT